MGQPRLSQDEVNKMGSLVKQGRSAPQILSQLQNALRECARLFSAAGHVFSGRAHCFMGGVICVQSWGHLLLLSRRRDTADMLRNTSGLPIAIAICHCLRDTATLLEICKSLDQDCLASPCSGTRLGAVRFGGTWRQKGVWDVYKVYTTTIQQLYNNYTTTIQQSIQQLYNNPYFVGFLRNTHQKQ